MKRPLPARLARWALTAMLGIALASILVVAAFRWLPVPITAFMIGERFAATPGQPLKQRHEWVPWERISRHAGIAVIAAEDQQFLVHDGFDFAQIEKAMTDAGRGKRDRLGTDARRHVLELQPRAPGGEIQRAHVLNQREIAVVDGEC
jgi:membrane peptidoglycan carboxypeptidase